MSSQNNARGLGSGAEVKRSTNADSACPQGPVTDMQNRTVSVGLPRLFTAKEASVALRTTENWVKERARRREIPFTLIGGSYRFTAEHLEEIVERFEQRPESTPGRPVTTPRRRAQPASPQQRSAVVPLKAREPRRRPKAG